MAGLPSVSVATVVIGRSLIPIISAGICFPWNFNNFGNSNWRAFLWAIFPACCIRRTIFNFHWLMSILTLHQWTSSYWYSTPYTDLFSLISGIKYVFLNILLSVLTPLLEKKVVQKAICHFLIPSSACKYPYLIGQRGTDCFGTCRYAISNHALFAWLTCSLPERNVTSFATDHHHHQRSSCIGFGCHIAQLVRLSYHLVYLLRVLLLYRLLCLPLANRNYSHEHRKPVMPFDILKYKGYCQ